MRPHDAAAPVAVSLSTSYALLDAGWVQSLISLAAGLIAVWVARLVFITRENRQLHRQQTWRETVPLTVVAMLIAGAFIWQNSLKASTAIYVGLGVGWVAVILLDILGQRVMETLRTALGGGPASPALPPAADISGNDGVVTSAEIPPSMAEILDRIDAAERARRA